MRHDYDHGLWMSRDFEGDGNVLSSGKTVEKKIGIASNSAGIRTGFFITETSHTVT